MAELLKIEVCLALPEGALRRNVECEAGANCGQVVARSGLLDEARRLGIEIVGVGVFGKRRLPSDPVRAGDRIELYRALSVDPNESRLRRARLQRTRRTGR